MTLHYRLKKGESGVAEVHRLEEFLEWLAGLGIGGDDPSPKSLEEFSEAYRDMTATGKARILFAKPFDERQEVLTIDRVEL
jgi:hypothetical protein